MAKKTDKKLSLKRETLRTLDSDQLGAVVGGAAGDVAAGGLKGTVSGTSPGPTKTDTFGTLVIEQNYFVKAY